MQSKNFKISLALGLAGLTVSQIASAVTAVPIAVTGGITYENPANISQVQDNEIQVGASFIPDGKEQFKGTVAGNPDITGSDTSESQLWLGYFRYAQRLNDKFVAAFDFYQPFSGQVNWDADGIQRNRTPSYNITSVEMNPKISYQATDKLAFGAGIRGTWAKENTYFGVPSDTDNFGPYFDQNNSGYGLGWDTGVSYTFLPYNFIGLSYFSKINVDTDGTSVTDFGSSNNYATTITEPAQWVINYFGAVSEKWMISARAYYGIYSAIDTVTAENLALVGTQTFPVDAKNIWTEEGAIIYNYNDKVSLIAGGGHSASPIPDENNNPAYATYPLNSVAVGARIMANKSVAVQPSIARLWGSGDINNVQGDVGHVNGSYMIYSVGFTISTAS